MKQFQHLCYTAMSATTARTLYPHFVTWRPAQTPVTSPASPPSPHSQSSRVSSSLSSGSSSQNCWSVSWVWKCAVCNLKSLLVLKKLSTLAQRLFGRSHMHSSYTSSSYCCSCPSLTFIVLKALDPPYFVRNKLNESIYFTGILSTSFNTSNTALSFSTFLFQWHLKKILFIFSRVDLILYSFSSFTGMTTFLYFFIFSNQPRMLKGPSACKKRALQQVETSHGH